MAATNHSQRLELSLWEQTDCPEWADFLQDNEKLEELVGGHLANGALHLTAEEKEFLSQRRAALAYTGTGSGAAEVELPFPPQRLTVFALGKPPMAPRADGCWDVFYQVWIQGEASPGSMGGVTVDLEALTAQLAQGAFSGETGLYHALNQQGVSYLVELEA